MLRSRAWRGIDRSASLPRALLAAQLWCLPGLASAAPPSSDAGAGAERAILAAEHDFRRDPRFVRMRIHTTVVNGPTVDRTIWAVVAGDAATTRLLYVFVAPEPILGMSLLVQDPIDPADTDSTWLYAPAFKSFRHLDPRNQKMFVPGTALTLEDARGFLPIDKYAFALAPADSAAPAAAPTSALLTLRGVPRTPILREAVGYERFLARIDTDRHLVQTVDYTGLDGQHQKTYLLLEPIRRGDVWLAKRVRVTHHVMGFESTIEYEYWPVKKSLEPALFRPAIEPESFYPRLERAAKREGLTLDP